MKNQKNNSALYTLVSVFFFWGFIAASNGVFIPFCKTYFSIDQFQSQLVDFAFYGAYYIGALILFIWSSQSGKDILNNWEKYSPMIENAFNKAVSRYTTQKFVKKIVKQTL